MNKLLISVTTAMALMAAGPAIAQQQGQGQQQGQQQGGAMQGQQSAPDTNFSDGELKKFVNAQEGINEVRDEYMSKIESADDQTRAQELQQEANNEMVKIIESENMEIQKYNAIATAYSSDPEVRERIDGMM